MIASLEGRRREDRGQGREDVWGSRHSQTQTLSRQGLEYYLFTLSPSMCLCFIHLLTPKGIGGAWVRRPRIPIVTVSSLHPLLSPKPHAASHKRQQEKGQ